MRLRRWGRGCAAAPGFFTNISQPYSSTVKLSNMIKNIYRIAIINNKDEVIYLSGIFFCNKKAAIEEIEKLTSFKEEAKPQECIDVCITIANNYTWKIFKKIKKDSKKRYTVGIITEALFVEDTDRLER